MLPAVNGGVNLNLRLDFKDSKKKTIVFFAIVIYLGQYLVTIVPLAHSYLKKKTTK